jgi:hypothetical protein
VRAAAQAGAAASARLGRHFVRLLGYERAGGEPVRNLWARVVTPAGVMGYVAPGGVRSLGSERLCYAKDMLGRWHIAGFIAGVN